MLPYMYAITTIRWKNQRSEKFLHEYLKNDTFAKAYQPFIQLVNGPNLWLNTIRDLMQPSIIKRLAEKPKKQRKEYVVEDEIK